MVYASRIPPHEAVEKKNSSPSTPLDPARDEDLGETMLNDLSPLFLRSGLGSLLLLPLQLSCELLAEAPSQHRNRPSTYLRPALPA